MNRRAIARMNLDPRDPDWDGPDEDEELEPDDDQDFDTPEHYFEYLDPNAP